MRRIGLSSFYIFSASFKRYKATTTSSKKDDVIPPYIGDVGRGLVEDIERMDLRMQSAWTQQPKFDNEEDSPQYFADGHPKDLIFRVDVVNAGKVKWPLVPDMDARILSNCEWLQARRQEMALKYCKKHGLEDIFPALRFGVNLNVRYSDMYWHSVFFGNHLPPSEVQAAPAIQISADATPDTPSDTLFTLAMFTPDYPFRTNPEDGHLLHWMICNVPLGSEGEFDTVVDYLPPLPTEYAGHFRYIFALFPQEGGRIKLPAGPSTRPYPLRCRRNFFLHGNRARQDPEDFNIMHVQQRLSTSPLAMTFFHSSYDIEVTENYQRLQLEEPIYTPDNVLKQLLMHEKYTDRGAFRTFHKKPDWPAVWPLEFPRHPSK